MTTQNQTTPTTPENDRSRIAFSVTTDKARFAAPADKASTRTIEGYAVVWGAASSPNIWGERFRFLRGSINWIEPVLALYHHSYAAPIGRKDNGTLRINEDDYGVHVEIDLPDTTVGRDVYEMVRTKLVTGMSFGAYIRKTQPVEGERDLYEVLKTDVDEVTATAIPSMTETSLGVKKMLNARVVDTTTRPNDRLRLARLKLASY